MWITFWFREPRRHYMSWFRLVSATTIKDDCTSYYRRPAWIPIFTLILCYWNWLQAARLFCQLAWFSNMTVHLHSARTACVVRDWITTKCTRFIGKHEWPPNSPDLNPLDYYFWGDNARALPHEAELKDALQLIWDELPQNSINKALLCVKAGAEHFRDNKSLFCIIELLCLLHFNHW